MTWDTYLNNASAALFGTGYGKTGKPHRKSDALNILKQTIGLIPLNVAYFTNAEYISHDLTLFVRAWNISVHDLSTSNPARDTRIILANGESITWQVYLQHASAALFGNTKGKDGETHRPSDVLNRLKKTIGLILLDENYFTHEEYITRDLIKFSQRILLKGEEDRGESKESGKWEELQSLEERKNSNLQRIHVLSVKNPSRNTHIILANGESMTWAAYLDNASTALFGTGYRKPDNPHRRSDALNRLKKTMKLILLDADYFKKPEYITKDLEAFAEIWDISVHNLSTTNPVRDTQITLANGESMTWVTYLRNAWKLLDPGKKYTQAQALGILKERAGFATSASAPQEEKDIKIPKVGTEFESEPFAA